MNSISLGEQNYQGFADRYAAEIQKHHVRLYYELPAAQALIGDVGGLQVLDAGCGGGDYTLMLLEQGAELTACDVMPQFVQKTRERSQGYARVFQADLRDPLTFAEDESFDLVVSFLTLHYLEDWSGILGEFWRVLRRGGRLVFSCMHPMTDTQQVNYFEVGQYQVTWENFPDPKPVMQMVHRPLMSILNGLSQAGFCLTDCLEPQPLPELADHSPEEYHLYSEKPIFLFLAASK